MIKCAPSRARNTNNEGSVDRKIKLSQRKGGSASASISDEDGVTKRRTHRDSPWERHKRLNTMVKNRKPTGNEKGDTTPNIHYSPQPSVTFFWAVCEGYYPSRQGLHISIRIIIIISFLVKTQKWKINQHDFLAPVAMSILESVFRKSTFLGCMKWGIENVVYGISSFSIQVGSCQLVDLVPTLGFSGETEINCGPRGFGVRSNTERKHHRCNTVKTIPT